MSANAYSLAQLVPRALPELHDRVDATVRAPMQPRDVYASIEAALARSAQLTWQEPWGSCADAVAPLPLLMSVEPRPVAGLALPQRSQRYDVPRAAPLSSLVEPPALTPPARGTSRRFPWLVLPSALLALLPFAWWTAAPEPEPVLAPVPVLASPPGDPARTAAAPLPPDLELLVEPGDRGEARIADEMMRAVADAGGVALAVHAGHGGADALVTPSGSAPRLAIAHYDGLQDARLGGGAALRVVMPLYAEEVHFVVRAESPLRFIHEVEGRRIHVGPAQSSAALTAATLYERMFGRPLPRAPGSFAAPDEALAQLLTGALDAMVLVAPAPWWQSLPAQTAASLKLLALDPAAPASRRALQHYLPASMQAGASDTPTLAVMSFLVTSAGADADQSIGRFARALCAGLPALRRDGHPKWREVQPGLQLEAGWPYASSAQAALRDCAGASPAASSTPVRGASS